KGWRLHVVAAVIGLAAGSLLVLGVVWLLGLGKGSDKAADDKELAAALERLSGADADAAAAAGDALVKIGANAVPPLLERRRDGDMRLHRRAVAALARLGRPAAAGLVQALASAGDQAGRVETALARMGGDAVPTLVEALTDARRGPDAA